MEKGKFIIMSVKYELTEWLVVLKQIMNILLLQYFIVFIVFYVLY